mgnify:CR=1 FL=1
MAIKPILFNTEMVRAILDGRKSCTRRIIKPQPQGYFEVSEEPLYIYDTDGKQGKITPPYQPGDILYVRETWRVGAWDIFNQMIAFDYKDGTCGELTYIHDRELFDRLVNQSRNDARQAKCEYNGADFVWEKGKSPCRWHPSIHMPKEAARIWLKVTDVRVERLQEMTDDDAEAEGCFDYTSTALGFPDVWDSTIKKSDLDRYGWDASPWVWVIEFERCEKPETL